MGFFFFYQTDWKHGYSQHPHHCTLHKTPKFPYSFLFRKAPTILINNNMYSEKNSILIYFCPHCKWTNSNFQTFKIILLLTKLWNSEHGSIRSNQTSTGIPALAVNKLHFYFIYWFISIYSNYRFGRNSDFHVLHNKCKLFKKILTRSGDF